MSAPRPGGRAPHEIERLEAYSEELAANVFKACMFGVVGFLAMTWLVMA